MVRPGLLFDVVTMLFGICGIIKRCVFNGFIIDRDVGIALIVVSVIYGVLTLTLGFY